MKLNVCGAANWPTEPFGVYSMTWLALILGVVVSPIGGGGAPTADDETV